MCESEGSSCDCIYVSDRVPSLNPIANFHSLTGRSSPSICSFSGFITVFSTVSFHLRSCCFSTLSFGPFSVILLSSSEEHADNTGASITSDHIEQSAQAMSI